MLAKTQVSTVFGNIYSCMYWHFYICLNAELVELSNHTVETCNVQFIQTVEKLYVYRLTTQILMALHVRIPDTYFTQKSNKLKFKESSIRLMKPSQNVN